MKTILILITFIMATSMNREPIDQQKPVYRTLSKEESRVILEKGTERPWTGKYTNAKEKGTYVCNQCGAALYRSDAKFDSDCGWPSFDDEIKGSVKRVPDADGRRTEIICASCNGHLGHVFEGEGFTEKDTRHCVNSVSLDFVPAVLEKGTYTTAIFAGGCFWGVEYYLQKEPGVLAVVSGYIGGHVKNPSYKEVCTGKTGHAEAVRVVYDPDKTTYDRLVRLFLEIHDPTQVDRQGPDIGSQYRSGIFYLNEEQRKIAASNLEILRQKGYKIATELTPATEFYDAEDYHQDYYFENGKTPYCHGYTKRF
jgi:peptide methionine sulfoxide reductase msrA/msrB